jgi:hypothetical protein
MGVFTVRTVAAVPKQLEVSEVLILNSIFPTAEGSIPENQILEFINAGGGVFAIHDSVYPYTFNRAFIAACGIRAAYGAMQMVVEPNRHFMQV